MNKPTQLISFDIEAVSLHRNFRSSKTISPQGIEEMAESILEHGIIQPPPAILVDGQPQVTMGQRRYFGFIRAGQLATERELETLPWTAESALSALTKIPLLVSDIDERTVMLQQMVENLQREDVALRDEAEGYAYLQREHSMKLDEIARRIGKSKQRVSACIKLCQVPDELWAAYEEKKISSEHLVLVGRVPHTKDRVKLVKWVLTPKYNGLLPTREELSNHVKSDYMISLRGCAWKLDDAELVAVQHESSEPGAARVLGGACKDCPFRSGNDPDLEVQQASKTEGSKAGVDPNLCLNPTCHRLKEDAAWKQAKVKAEQDGVKVLSDAEAKDYFESYGGHPKHSTGMVLVDEEPDYYATGAHGSTAAIEDQTWEDLIDKKALKSEVVLCRHPKTKKVVRMIDRERAIQLAEEKLGKKGESPFAKRPKPQVPVSPQDQQKKTDADRRKRERENKISEMTTKLLWDGMAEGLRTKPMTAAMLKIALRQAYTLATYDSADLLLGVCGLTVEEDWNDDVTWLEVEKCVAKDIGKDDKESGYVRWIVLFLSMAECELTGYQGNSAARTNGVAAMMRALRIDAEKLEAKATEAVKAQEKEVARGEADAKRKAREGMAGTGQSGAPIEELFTCEGCGHGNFTKSGLKSHNCEKRQQQTAAAEKEEVVYHDEAHYHCDKCGKVCLVPGMYVAEVEAMKVGEFVGNCCDSKSRFGHFYDDIQAEYEDWPLKKALAWREKNPKGGSGALQDELGMSSELACALIDHMIDLKAANAKK